MIAMANNQQNYSYDSKKDVNKAPQEPHTIHVEGICNGVIFPSNFVNILCLLSNPSNLRAISF